MTASSYALSTIEQILYAQINIVTFTLPCNLDPVLKGRDGSMCPTAATVMWNVLVQHFSQIRLAIDVVPVPVIRDVVLGQVSMRERRDYMAPLCMAFHELDLIPVLRHLDSGGSRDGGGSGSEAKGDLHCSASSVLARVLVWREQKKEDLCLEEEDSEWNFLRILLSGPFLMPCAIC